MSALNLPHVGEWSRLLHRLHRDGLFCFVFCEEPGKDRHTPHDVTKLLFLELTVLPHM